MKPAKAYCKVKKRGSAYVTRLVVGHQAFDVCNDDRDLNGAKWFRRMLILAVSKIQQDAKGKKLKRKNDE